MRGSRQANRQWLALVALVLATLLSGCPPRGSQEPKLGGGGHADAPWMDIKHPGPFTTLGDASLGLNERCTACHQFSQLSTIEPLGNPHEGFHGLVVASPRGAEDEIQTIPAAKAPPEDPLSVSSAHPAGWLRWHNPARFACTACHGGDGSGTSYREARHHQMIRPMTDYGPLTQAMQARCGTCHSGEYVPSAPLLSRGRSLIRELNCAACHEVSPQLAGTKQGPSLARAAEKLAPEVLFHKPNNASAWQVAHQSSTHMQMPQFELSDESAAKITAYLQSLVPAEHHRVYGQESLPPPRPAGLELIKAARCGNCHTIAEARGAVRDPEDPYISTAEIGPSLVRIHERVSAEWIADYLAEPHAWYPETRMPAYRLSKQERQEIADWLIATSQADFGTASLELPATVRGQLQQPSTELVEAGRTEFISQGCAGCHKTGDTSLNARLVGPSLLGIGDKPREQWPDKARSLKEVRNLTDYLHWAVSAPELVGPGLMPTYSLSHEDRAAIVTALLAETATVWPGTDKPLPPHYAKDLNSTVASTAPSPRSPDFHKEFWDFPQLPEGSGGQSNKPGVTLSLAERGLHPRSCGQCHTQQYSEWKHSRHGLAMSPGVTGQMVEWVTDPAKQAEYHSCLKCHATLAEQSHIRKTAGGQWEQNPHYAGDELYVAGLTCMSCHVRAHTRYGPDPPREQYNWDSSTLSAHALERSDFLRESEFCAHCHQFDESARISNGPPLQNTHVEHREWLARTAKPQSCQDCHMPGGSHRWLGIHDADFVRDSLDITHSHKLVDGRMRASITLVNARNGHHFPTYVTPRVWLHGYFTDSADKQISGTFKDSVIARDARNREKEGGGTEWYDVFDTRVPAGESFSFSYDEPVPDGAARFHLEVFCAPDHFYYEAYGKWLEQEWRSAAGLEQLAAARDESHPDRTGFYLLRESFTLD